MNYIFQATYELNNGDLINIRDNLFDAVREYIEDCYGVIPSRVPDEVVRGVIETTLEV